MKVLLLGASGLLGHNVLSRLVAEGHRVGALVRRPDTIQLQHDGFEVVIGSPLDYPTLCRAAERCDAVINCTGATDMSMLRYGDFLPVNRDLCSLLVRLLEEHGIGTLVHTSTVNTIGYGRPGQPADESAAMREPFKGSYYADSKREGEEIVLSAAGRWPDRHIVVINPGYMIGPMDVKPSSGRMLLAAYRRRLMLAPKGGKCFVHVGDVAQAVVNALTRGLNGSRYIVVGDDGCHTIKELYQIQASVMGYHQRVLAMPNWLLYVAGGIGDAIRALGIRTELSTRNVKQLMVGEYYSNHHAINDLKINSTPLVEAIKDFYQWREKEQSASVCR